MVWGYLELSHFLYKVDGPSIFPDQLSTQHLFDLLLKNNSENGFLLRSSESGKKNEISLNI